MTPIRSKRTKVVCTIGPASRDPETLRAMIRGGMNVARINFAHGTQAEHRGDIASLRRLAREEGAVVAVMADLQGPKIRIGLVDPEPRPLHAGERVVLSARAERGAPDEVSFPHPEAIATLKANDRLIIGDGDLQLIVEKPGRDELVCLVSVAGDLYSRRGVSVPPGTALGAPVTPKDKEDAAFALDQGVDFLALSFVRRGQDILELRRLVVDRSERVGIVAKIETRQALEDFPSILDAADAVMVARGDLGTEVPVEQVPFHQKEIIRRSNAAGKPVITATQMLQSMMDHPEPTRAEASDVANAVLDGTDAVMLSGETAIGRYPVLAVEMLTKIASTVEERMLGSVGRPGLGDAAHREPITDAISHATATIARELGASLILTSTFSGYTARQVARERPAQPIIAFTRDDHTLRQMALSWGVVPFLLPSSPHTDALLAAMIREVLARGLARKGDLMVITGALPQGGGGSTNFLKVERL